MAGLKLHRRNCCKKHKSIDKTEVICYNLSNKSKTKMDQLEQEFPSVNPRGNMLENHSAPHKLWSDLLSADNPRRKFLGSEYLAGLDQEAANWGLSAQEFAALSSAEQTQEGEKLKEMITDITLALRKANSEVPASESSPELSFEIITAKELEELAKSGYKFFTNPSDLHIAYDIQSRAASDENSARKEWSKISGKDLVQHDIIVFDLTSVLDPENRFANIGAVSLPVLNGDIEKTKEIAIAVYSALARLNELAQHSAVQEALDNYLEDPVEVARATDVGEDSEKMKKHTPIRMYVEAIITTAQTMAMAMADTEEPYSIAEVGMTMAHKYYFEKIARSIPLGVTGPLTLRGIVPKDGLLKRINSGLEMDAGFEDDIKKKRRFTTEEYNLLFGAAALAKSLPEELSTEDVNNKYRTILDLSWKKLRKNLLGRHPATYSRGRGCPAVFVDKGPAGSPIELASYMLLAPFMPKRPASKEVKEQELVAA
jgi:hypothetical protein